MRAANSAANPYHPLIIKGGSAIVWRMGFDSAAASAKPTPVDISLLAIDIDGTLVVKGDEVPAASRVAVRQAIDHGFTVMLATGRRYRTTRLVIDQLGVPLAAVCLGGALTKDENGTTLASAAFAASQIARLLELSRQCRLTLLLQRDSHEHCGPDFIVDAGSAWNINTRLYMEANGNVGHVDPAPEASNYEGILMLGCFAERAPLAELQRNIDALGEFATVLVESKKTPGWYLEVMLAHVNKWTALQRFAANIGVAESAICAVGDAANDLPMLRGAALGVAMGNAEAKVKAAADWVTGSNTENGLAALIDRLAAARARFTQQQRSGALS